MSVSATGIGVNRLQSFSPPITLPSRTILPSPARRARSISNNEAASPSKLRLRGAEDTNPADKPFTAAHQRSYLFLVTADVLVWAIATVDETSRVAHTVSLTYHYYHQPTGILGCDPLPLDYKDPNRSLVVWYWPENKTLVTAAKNEIIFRRTSLAHGVDTRTMSLNVHLNKKRDYSTCTPSVSILIGTPYGVVAQQFDRSGREPLFFVPWNESSSPQNGLHHAHAHTAPATGLAWDKAFYWTDSEGVRVSSDARVRYEHPFVAVCRHPMLFLLDASARTRRQYNLAPMFEKALGPTSKVQCTTTDVLLIEPNSHYVLIQCALSASAGTFASRGLQHALFLFEWENNQMTLLPSDIVAVPIALSGNFVLFVGQVPESYDAGKWRWYLGRYSIAKKQVDIIDRYVLSCHEAPTRSEIIAFWRRTPLHSTSSRSLAVSLWNGSWRYFGSNLLPFLCPMKSLQARCEDAIVKHQLEFRRPAMLCSNNSNNDNSNSNNNKLKLSAALQHRLSNYWRAPHSREEILLPQMYS